MRQFGVATGTSRCALLRALVRTPYADACYWTGPHLVFTFVDFPSTDDPNNVNAPGPLVGQRRDGGAAVLSGSVPSVSQVCSQSVPCNFAVSSKMSSIICHVWQRLWRPEHFIASFVHGTPPGPWCLRRLKVRRLRKVTRSLQSARLTLLRWFSSSLLLPLVFCMCSVSVFGILGESSNVSGTASLFATATDIVYPTHADQLIISVFSSIRQKSAFGCPVACAVRFQFLGSGLFFVLGRSSNVAPRAPRLSPWKLFGSSQTRFSICSSSILTGRLQCCDIFCSSPLLEPPHVCAECNFLNRVANNPFQSVRINEQLVMDTVSSAPSSLSFPCSTMDLDVRWRSTNISRRTVRTVHTLWLVQRFTTTICGLVYRGSLIPLASLFCGRHPRC